MFQGNKVGVIIPAAGRGSRLEGDQPKQFMDLNGKSILVRTVTHFLQSPLIDLIVIAANQQEINFMKQMINKDVSSKRVGFTIGGKQRQDSVWNCLKFLDKESMDIVVVHDAVRPFITQDIIGSVLVAAMKYGAAVAAVQPKDTIKLSNGDQFVQSTIHRDQLWIIQTPQAFQAPLLRQAFEKAQADNFYGTDDASLVERLGKKVKIVPGSYDNIKITTREDFELAQLIAQRMQFA